MTINLFYKLAICCVKAAFLISFSIFPWHPVSIYFLFPPLYPILIEKVLRHPIENLMVKRVINNQARFIQFL